MPDRLMHEGQVMGNYRLLHSLGRGGFAEVYLARHVHLNRLAAIKLLYTQVDGPDVLRFSMRKAIERPGCTVPLRVERCGCCAKNGTF